MDGILVRIIICRASAPTRGRLAQYALGVAHRQNADVCLDARMGVQAGEFILINLDHIACGYVQFFRQRCDRIRVIVFSA